MTKNIADFAEDYSVLAAAELYDRGLERMIPGEKEVAKGLSDYNKNVDKQREKELFERYKATGDEVAFKEFVSMHTRLVYWFLEKYFSWTVGHLREELIGEGNVWLTKAAKRYDPSRAAFSTYAGRCIYGAFRTYLSQNVEHQRVRSLDSTHGEGLTLLDDISQARELAPEDFSSIGDLKQILRKGLGGLKPRDREILTRRFGLDGNDPETLAGIGKSLSITRSAVETAEKRALERLGENIGVSYEQLFCD